jgi:hypothetical protein
VRQPCSTCTHSHVVLSTLFLKALYCVSAQDNTLPFLLPLLASGPNAYPDCSSCVDTWGIHMSPVDSDHHRTAKSSTRQVDIHAQ